MLRIRRDDSGNMIIAIAVIMIVVILGVTMTARTVANIHTVSHMQNFAGGLADADAGVSDAMFRLDNGATSTFCVTPDPTSCPVAATSVPANSGVRYKATKVNSNKWVIDSVGKQFGVEHAVRVTVTDSARYPYAIYGNTGLTFNGRNSGGFGTFDSSVGPSSFDPNGNVAVGSNGAVDCHGSLPSNVAVVYGTAESGCNQFSSGPYQALAVQNPPATSTPWTCPDGGLLGDGYGAANGTLAAGVYVCPGEVKISGNLAITGGDSGADQIQDCTQATQANSAQLAGVCLYIQMPSGSNSTGQTDLDIVPGSSINNAGTSAPPPYPNTKPYLFQVFSNGLGNFGDENGLPYYFSGIIYAPQASLTQDGCKSVYYGSLVINTLSCNGAPNLSVYYDSKTGSLVTPWAVGSYSEVGTTSVSVP